MSVVREEWIWMGLFPKIHSLFCPRFSILCLNSKSNRLQWCRIRAKNLRLNRYKQQKENERKVHWIVLFANLHTMVVFILNISNDINRKKSSTELVTHISPDFFLNCLSFRLHSKGFYFSDSSLRAIEMSLKNIGPKPEFWIFPF